MIDVPGKLTIRPIGIESSIFSIPSVCSGDAPPNAARIAVNATRSSGPATGCSRTSDKRDSSVSGNATRSPATSIVVCPRRSRLEAPTSTRYVPSSTTHRSTRTSQYARSSRRMTMWASTVAPGTIGTDANALSSRGARCTREEGSEV